MSRLKINLEAIERDSNANAEGFSADGGVRIGSLLVSSEGVRDSAGHYYVLSLNDFDVVPEAEGGFLGRGSSGSVRRAIHRRSNTAVALKEIKVTGRAHMSEIRKELETLHAGDSATPYLVNFYGAFTHEGAVFIAMEAMDGSLQEVVKPVPLPVLACMTRQMLRGLVYLHRTRHLMHRDLKPSNVLYNSRTGDIKISDFGVSSFLECTKADAHSFVGTVTYMSPERLHGDSYSYGADIWSLGLVVAELALGTCPFAALRGESSEGRFWALIQHLNGVGPALELPPDMERTLADFINACVVKAPDQRATCSDLLHHPFIKKFTVTASSPGASSCGSKGGGGSTLLTPPAIPTSTTAVTGGFGSNTSRSPLFTFPVTTRPFEAGPLADGGVSGPLTTSAMSSPATSSPQERHEGEAEEDAADHAVIQQWLHSVEERAARQRQRQRQPRSTHQKKKRGGHASESAGQSGGHASNSRDDGDQHGDGPNNGRSSRGGGGGGEGSGGSTLHSTNGGEQPSSSQGEGSTEKSRDQYSGDSGSACNSRDATTGQNPAFDSQRAGGEPSVNLDDELNKLLQ